MQYSWLWGDSSYAVISTASCSDPSDLAQKKTMLSCDCVADERDTGDRWQVMVKISKEEEYIVTAVVVAAVVVRTVIVAAAVLESRLMAVVLVVKEISK